MSDAFFISWMDALNIAIHKPQKDNCDFCGQHELGDIDDPDYAAHREHPDLARELKKQDKKSDESTIVFAVDTKALLQCPMIDTDSFISS